MSEHLHTTEGDIECSCQPLILSVGEDGSISRIAGGTLEEPIDTGVDQPRHGSHAMYSRGCRCDTCVEFRRSYDRERYRRQHPSSAVLDVARLFTALANVTGQRWDGEAIAAEYDRLGEPTND